MDDLIRFHSNINYAKTIEDILLKALRKLHEPWIFKKEQNEIDQEVDQVVNEIDLELEQLKKIDQLLNKAKTVISKIEEKCPVQKDREPSADLKKNIQQPIKPSPRQLPTLKQPTNAKENSKSVDPISTTTTKKSNYKPAYLNAPYKTQQVKPPLKPIRTLSSAKSMLSREKSDCIALEKEMATTSKRIDSKNVPVKSSATKNENPLTTKTSEIQETSKDNANPIAASSSSSSVDIQKPILSLPSIASKNPNECIFTLKDDGKHMRLPHELQSLIVKNQKLKQSVDKLMKHKHSTNSVGNGEHGFIDKLQKSFDKTTKYKNSHYFVHRYGIIFDNLTDLTRHYRESSKDKVFAHRLEVFFDILKEFDSSLNDDFKKFKLTDFSIVNDDFTLDKQVDCKPFRDFGFHDLEQNSIFPLVYNSVNDLIRYNQVKCLFVELNYLKNFYNFIETILIRYHELDKIEEPMVEHFAGLFNLITKANVIVVKS